MSTGLFLRLTAVGWGAKDGRWGAGFWRYVMPVRGGGLAAEGGSGGDPWAIMSRTPKTCGSTRGYRGWVCTSK